MGYRPELYSRRVTTWAHCLYLREPAALSALGLRTPAALLRLVAMALAFDQFDLALEVAALLRSERLLAPGLAEGLFADVERWATWATRRVLHETQRQGLGESVLAPEFRDRKRLE
jgi:hypothetical protein